MQEIIKNCETGMEKRLAVLDKDLQRLRSGRASINLVDGVKVDCYGTATPLNQVGTLTTPDARTISIAPFEKKLIQDIEKAIMKADLGLQPTNDGNVIRIPIPPLTEERRKDLVKQIKKMGEEAKVSIRQARRDANDSVKKLEKSKDVAEDESKRLQTEIQKVTDNYTKRIDERLAAKEKEVMKV